MPRDEYYCKERIAEIDISLYPARPLSGKTMKYGSTTGNWKNPICSMSLLIVIKTTSSIPEVIKDTLHASFHLRKLRYFRYNKLLIVL